MAGAKCVLLLRMPSVTATQAHLKEHALASTLDPAKHHVPATPQRCNVQHNASTACAQLFSAAGSRSWICCFDATQRRRTASSKAWSSEHSSAVRFGKLISNALALVQLTIVSSMTRCTAPSVRQSGGTAAVALHTLTRCTHLRRHCIRHTNNIAQCCAVPRQ